MGKKLTTEEFISKARAVHGEKYDYSLVEYITNHDKVKIRCIKHDTVFLQTPSHHLSGKNGCPKCSGRNMTTEYFIEKARLVHGDKYDYSLVEYVSVITKVKIICNKHKTMFEQTPNSHLSGSGCPKCGIELNAKSKELTTEEFIRRAKLIHGENYDYSLVEYINAKTKVKIICKNHNSVFYQVPNSHLSGNGCPKCGFVRMTTEEFIKKAKEVHGETYDYSLVVYTNDKEKVQIICKEHGPFFQNPSTHLTGKGCEKCGRIRTGLKQKSNLEEFVIKARKVHGDKYDYSQGEYLGHDKKIFIICPEHKGFWQVPKDHIIKGCGCPKCVGKHITKEDFVTKAREIHGDNYDYSLVEYNGNKNHVKIRCIKHNLIFEQTPYSHLKGNKCPICSKKYKKTREEFIIEAQKIHGDKYDYSLVEYKGVDTKVKIRCIKHNFTFCQTPDKHLNNRGCPICKLSKGEGRISDFLNQHNINYVVQHRFNDCKSKKTLSFDFYLPERNICVEYDGIQHYKPILNFGGEKAFIKNKERDEIKTKYCQDNQIKLLRISYKDFDKIEEILCDFLKEIV